MYATRQCTPKRINKSLSNPTKICRCVVSNPINMQTSDLASIRAVMLSCLLVRALAQAACSHPSPNGGLSILNLCQTAPAAHMAACTKPE